MQNFKYKHSLAFTLVELIVAVAIISIIAAIALPSYMEQLRSSKRKDAIYSLTDIVNKMERYYSEYNTYVLTSGTTLADSLLATNASQDGLYSLAITDRTVSGFKATATARGSQARDDNCDTLTITNTGVKTSTGAYNTSGNGLRCWL